MTPWAVAPQPPLPMEISRQEYWSGFPCSPPGDFPNPGIELRSPALQVDFLSYEPPGKPMSIPRQQLWSDSGGQLTSQLNLEKGVRAQPLWMRKENKSALHYQKITSIRPPWWLRGKASSCQCRRHRLCPWPGKIPHSAEQLDPCATTTEPVL